MIKNTRQNYIYTAFKSTLENASPSSSLLSYNLLENQSTLVYKINFYCTETIFPASPVALEATLLQFHQNYFLWKRRGNIELFSLHFALGAWVFCERIRNCADPCSAGFACQSSQITSVTHCGCYILKTRKSDFLTTFPLSPHPYLCKSKLQLPS